jgi:hypothetical protein
MINTIEIQGGHSTCQQRTFSGAVKSSQDAGLWTHIPGAVAFHTPNDVHALDATSSNSKGRESAKE